MSALIARRKRPFLNTRPTPVTTEIRIKPMGFYQNQIVPFLIDLAMRQQNLVAYRSRIVSAAEGRVLEIGIGSGRNLPFYSQRVARVIGLDPSPKLLSMARGNPGADSDRCEFVE